MPKEQLLNRNKRIIEREYEENANLADDKASAAKDKADESAQKAAAATEDAVTESKKIADSIQNSLKTTTLE